MASSIAASHALHVVGVQRADDPQLGAERACGKAEQRFGVGRPRHLAGREVPLPGGDLRRPPSPCAAAPRSRGRPGARRSAPPCARATRSSSSWLACCSASCAFCRSAISRWSASFSSASARVFRNSSTNTRDLRAQDVGVDRLAQVVDRADAVAAQDVVVVEQVGGQEQDRDVLRCACAA